MREHSTALPQILWEKTVWDRIPWKQKISFLLILCGSDKAHITPYTQPPTIQLKHTALQQ